MTVHFAQAPAEPLAPHDGAPLLQRSGEFLRLTLNRPAEHNRLDPADVNALLALFERISTDGSTRALVITGAGETTFSSGYTLHSLVDELESGFERMLDALEALPITTIAVLNGSVYGGATDLALCCDLRIGTPGLKMFMPASRFGLHYYSGGLRRYVTRLGLPAASKIMLTGATIESDEMLRIGFLSELVARDKLSGRVDAFLDLAARNETTIVAQMKRHMHALAQASIPAELMTSLDEAYRASLASPELSERLAALLDSRKESRKRRENPADEQAAVEAQDPGR
jgi:enoyl-CoA hydratase/carnithine racemase